MPIVVSQRQYATRQPQGSGWRIDKTGLPENSTFLLPVGNRLVDASRVIFPTITGTTESTIGSQWGGLRAVNFGTRAQSRTLEYGTNPFWTLDGLTKWSVIIGCYRQATGSQTDEETLFCDYDGTPQTGVLLRYDSQTARYELFVGKGGGGGNDGGGVVGASQEDTNHHVVVARGDGSNLSVWIDGKKNTGAAQTVAVQSSSVQHEFGQRSGTDPWGGGITFAYVIPGYISEATVRQLSANPWGRFYREQPIFAPAAAPTGATPHSPFGICLHGPFAGPIG